MKRVNMYAVIREMREQVVKTMQERGIKELATCMSYAEWCKENKREPEEDESDDTDYLDYIDQEAPYVIFFNKYGTGYDYRVDKVKLIAGGAGVPVLEFECYANELGDDTFREDDLAFLTLYGVYDLILDLLGVEDEPESVYLVKQESNVDGELHFNVVPCKDMETAKRVLAEEVNTLLAESPKYKDAKRWMDGDDTLDYDDCPYSWENDKDDAFYISCTCDDYHELITIEEKEIN